MDNNSKYVIGYTSDFEDLHFFTAFNNFDTLEKKSFKMEHITLKIKVPFKY